jgi:hypothetical protein
MTAKGKKQKQILRCAQDDNGKRQGSKMRARIFCGKKNPESLHFDS